LNEKKGGGAVSQLLNEEKPRKGEGIKRGSVGWWWVVTTERVASPQCVLDIFVQIAFHHFESEKRGMGKEKKGRTEC
jgi:hypothetical protein